MTWNSDINHLLVSVIKFRKGLTKFMIRVALFKKLFITSVEICNMARCSSKLDDLRNINYVGCRARNITI